MASVPLPPPPKVFLSYSHDSPEHKDRVLALCDHLRADGVDAWIDEYETAPAEGWPSWCERRVAEADFVLVVCTEVYERRFRGATAPGEGLGARWEGYVARQELYEAGALNKKFIPVLWPPAVAEHVPLILRGATRYDLSGAEAYQNLYRHLTRQPKTPVPPLGSLVPMPPRERPVTHFPSGKGGRTAFIGGREPAPGEERLHNVDETVLLYVPGGEYTLGAEDIRKENRPIHRVVLSSFWIAKYPVTNDQYGRFLKATGTWGHPSWTNRPQQPVVEVSWVEAQAYCRWAGLRLPSEAQWEAAARGMDGRRYPWGNAEPTPEHANYGSREGGTTPVGSYPKGAGPFGALDQVGNVWEWCEDVWYGAAYQERNGQQDPVYTAGDPAVRCMRGGAWNSIARSLAAAFRYRSGASRRFGAIGFRCVLLADPEP